MVSGAIQHVKLVFAAIFNVVMMSFVKTKWTNVLVPAVLENDEKLDVG